MILARLVVVCGPQNLVLLYAAEGFIFINQYDADCLEETRYTNL